MRWELLVGIVLVAAGVIVLASGPGLHYTGAPGNLSGHVVSACDGTPIQGAGIRGVLTGRQDITATSDATGDYATQVVSADGSWGVAVSKSGYRNAFAYKYLVRNAPNVQDWALEPTGGCSPEEPPQGGPGPVPPTGPGGNTTTTTTDFDKDGVADSSDNCPTTSNADQADADGDGIGDACEAPPSAVPLIILGLAIMLLVVGIALVATGGMEFLGG